MKKTGNFLSRISEVPMKLFAEKLLQIYTFFDGEFFIIHI